MCGSRAWDAAGYLGDVMAVDAEIAALALVDIFIHVSN